MTENRKFKRLKTRLKVSYSRKNAFFSDYTSNISKGGMFIVSEKLQNPGSIFPFELHIPGLDSPLVMKGEVRWSISQTATSESGMGVKFLYQDDTTKEDIHSLVAGLMKESLGEKITDELLK